MKAAYFTVTEVVAMFLVLYELQGIVYSDILPTSSPVA